MRSLFRLFLGFMAILVAGFALSATASAAGTATKDGCTLTAKLVGLKSESGVMSENRVATLRCDAPKPKDPARTLRVYRGAGEEPEACPVPTVAAGVTYRCAALLPATCDGATQVRKIKADWGTAGATFKVLAKTSPSAAYKCRGPVS